VIWFLPLEPYHERYTAQMLSWVIAALERSKRKFKTVIAKDDCGSFIDAGMWTDVNRAARWRNDQLAQMLRHLQDRELRSGDVVLLGDAWFPGIEALDMAAKMQGINLCFAGWYYAGSQDRNDYLRRVIPEEAGVFEKMILGTTLSYLCVGSVWHYHAITEWLRARQCSEPRIVTAGLAWDSSEVERYRRPIEKRGCTVVFPHRWAPEKRPETFLRMAERYKDTGWKFAISTSGKAPIERISEHVEVVRHTSKADYYDFLSRCGVWYSASDQETFGYALHEAIALGLCIVAPRRVCYEQMLGGDSRFLYHGDDGESLLDEYLVRQRPTDLPEPPLEWTTRYNSSVDQFLQLLP